MSTHQISPDRLVEKDDWSDLKRHSAVPWIDTNRLRRYRTDRLKAAMRARDVSMCVMTSPISLRYAIDYRNYALFTAHIPCTYLFFPLDGDFKLHNAFDPALAESSKRTGRPISFMYGGDELDRFAEALAQDVIDYLAEIGCDNRRIGVEYVNPSITRALMKRGLEVVDGVTIVERARLIKSEDEVECIRWAMAVAELGAAKVKQALRPGVSEVQLWALLNYANLANNGDWHDGRMLASGPRINPWLQEASERRIEAGDLVGFDTDMIGPMGYFADLSRTFHCRPGRPTQRHKELYRLAVDEIEHNLHMVKAGVAFSDFQEHAYPVPEAYHDNAYPCILHGVGMCDEYPHLHPKFRGPLPYEGTLDAGMVVCIESYMGAKGERDGVKLEQQVLVADDGYELLTGYPYDEDLL